MAFVELAARSSFSFLRGASHPGELIQHARRLRLNGIAICDRDGLYGMARAHTEAKESGQTLYVGAELPLAFTAQELRCGCMGNAPPLSELQCSHLLPGPKPNALRKRLLAEDAYPAIILLVKDARGYANLCWLLTRAHAAMPKGECLLELDDLAGHTDGLMALVPTQLRRDWAAPRSDLLSSDSAPSVFGAIDVDAFSARMLTRLREVFSGSVYSLIYRRLDKSDRTRAQIAESRLRRHGLPIVASSWALYHCKSRKPLADVLSCIRLGTTLSEAKTKISPNGQAYLRSEAQMLRLFADQPEWVKRTANVAEELQFHMSQLQYHFPCTLPPGETPDEALERLSWAGAARRYPTGVPLDVKRQIEHELALIRRMKMASYFLSTWEVVEMARQRGILCQGRGSAANSAVCYALGITAVNPEQSNLLFERFMSDERKEPPDIDVDFEHERREEIIQEIYARYGRERAAMVSEVICYRRKSALREVSKVFGLSPTQCDRLVGAFAHWDPVTSADCTDRGLAARGRVGRRHDLRASAAHSDSEQRGSRIAGGRGFLSTTVRKHLEDSGLDANAAVVRSVLEIAHQLIGFPRHLSIHVGGFVLSSRPLFEVAPIEPARMEDRSVIPWDKDDLDALGFFKIDVLALGMLTAVRKALRLVWDSGGFSSNCAREKQLGFDPFRPLGFDPLEIITRIPDADPAVYAMASRGDTVGVFQIESRAQMAMLPRLRPRCFYDLVIEVAIVRPGPIQGGMVHPYLRRRNGEEAPDCHPLLAEILKRTLGVPLFQEQVMQIAIVGAGYSGGEADQLRRDMAAWKRTGRLMRHRQRLFEGFERNGIERRFGEALFEQIKGFGEYGFPESHAASFALLVYKSAWLKAHYPAHFLCALLNSQPMGFYSPSSLVRDAQKHGVEVQPVCVLSSDWDCTLELLSSSPRISSQKPGALRAVRLGLRMIKGLTRASAERIVNWRRTLPTRDARCETFADFDRQLPLPKRDLEVLAEAGAFQRLEEKRRQVLWAVSAPRQIGLFRDARMSEPAVELPALKPLEVLELDYERLRLSLTDHPLCHLRAELSRRSVLTALELGRRRAGARVSVAGLVTARQRPGTASGVVFMTLEDETGVANLIFYSRVFDAYRFVAQHSPLLLAEGKVERQDPEPSGDDDRIGLGASALGAASVVHLIVESVQRLSLGGPRLERLSRDFH